MFTDELKNEVFERFSDSYGQLLEQFIYKDSEMVREMFADEDVLKAYQNLVSIYFETIVEFYENNPDGTYLEELKYLKNAPDVKAAAKDYVDLTGDETLIRFLQVYSYCVQEPSGLVYNKSYHLVKNKVDGYFAGVHQNCLSMFEKFEKDINEGNYWWLKDSATTLRRQLSENIIVLNEKRFTNLCERYFSRKVDIFSEFINAVNGGEKLIPELDIAMAKNHNAKPYYCWWEYKPNGKKVLHMFDEPPAEGIYTYVAYHDRKEERAVAKDNYYL